MAEIDVMALNQTVKEQNYFVTQMMNEMNKAVVGQREMIEGIVMGLLTGVIFCWKAYQAWQKH